MAILIDDELQEADQVVNSLRSHFSMVEVPEKRTQFYIHELRSMEEGKASRMRKSVERRVRLFAHQQQLVVEVIASQQRRNTIGGKIEAELREFVTTMEDILS
mmetsp:Transcript_18386/g.18612  ORF Transcript_18386/g.18612 Transcript_18386/m.18612 type:complete len:103 (+) Transcript_18386:86-394(+)